MIEMGMEAKQKGAPLDERTDRSGKVGCGG